MTMKKHSQKGFSLVELMIAMVLSLVLMAGVVEIFLSSKQMYRVQDAKARLQENGRFAVQLLANEIRMAGYYGCVTRSGVEITNTLNNSSDYIWDFSIGIQGVEATGSSSWTPTIDASITQPRSGTDVLTIRGIDDPVIRVTAHPGGDPPGSANIQVNTGNGLESGDIVMVTDCHTAAVFQISAGNPNTSGSIPHNTGTGTPGNATQALGKDYTDGEIVKLSTTSYYIRDNGDIPSLYQVDSGNNAQELIQGVEAMQVLYGIDTDNNDVVDQYVAADSVTSWDDVLSVRISLLLRTIEDNLTVDSAQSYTFNGVTVADPGDRRLRAVFTRTVSLRNRVP